MCFHEILGTFSCKLWVYTVYFLHSEHVLIPHWNRCSSSTNTHTASKRLWKGAEQLERHLDFLMKPQVRTQPSLCGSDMWTKRSVISLTLCTCCRIHKRAQRCRAGCWAANQSLIITPRHFVAEWGSRGFFWGLQGITSDLFSLQTTKPGVPSFFWVPVVYGLVSRKDLLLPFRLWISLSQKCDGWEESG